MAKIKHMENLNTEFYEVKISHSAVCSPVLVMLHVVMNFHSNFLQSVGCKDQLLQLLCDYVKNLEKRVFPYAVEIKVKFTLHFCHRYPRLYNKWLR